MFKEYTVEDSDYFHEDIYPLVAREVNNLHGALSQFDSHHKADIVISFLKDHIVKSEWITENTQLVTRLTSGALQTSHIESLFSSCQAKPDFRRGLEAFISRTFAVNR